MEGAQAKLLKTAVSFLETYKIPYMITGAWSSIFYGRPRASHDIDFVVEIPREDVGRVVKSLKALPDEFLVQQESIMVAVSEKSMFNILHLPTQLKLDFWILTGGEFDQSRFKRKKKVKILGQLMEMATAEDTILQKLIWYKMGEIEKHLIDAAFVYQVQIKNINKRYLNSWIKKLGLKKYIRKLEKIDLDQYL